MMIDEFLSHFDDVKPRGVNKWQAFCPAHDDKKQSLSITQADDRILLHCHAGCEPEDILRAAGLRIDDLFFNNKIYSTPITTYDYTDESGKLLYQVCRYIPKAFKQRRPDKDGWIWNLKDIRRVLYHLPEVLKAKQVFLVEGEKDSDRLTNIGLTATTCPGGAGKWRDEYSECLTGKDVVILPDNDFPGQKHARQVARSLQGRATSVKVVKLPGLPDKGDISDWLDQGHSRDELLKLVEQASHVNTKDIEEPDGEDHPKKSQADTLIELAVESVETFFEDQYHTPFAQIPVNGHYELWPLQSASFKRWLGGLYYKTTGKGCNAEAMRTACNTLEAISIYNGMGIIKLHNRVAWHDDALWYDLSNEKWQAIKIAAKGWEIVDEPPILFRRYANQRPQVLPERNGDAWRFLDFTNLKDEDARLLALVWLISCLVPDIPHPVVTLYGAHGAAKSTFFKLAKRVIDPGEKQTDSMPRTPDELIKKLNNSWFTTFDNLSHLQNWQSDALCRAITGDGFSERVLYTNNEEFILSFQRVIGLNGINIVGLNPDLMDRSIILELERIDNNHRKSEDDLKVEFTDALPYILGGVFDVLSKAIVLYPRAKERLQRRLPRMADFTIWGYAIAEALDGLGETFLDAYLNNIKRQNEQVIESDPVAVCLVKFMEKHDEWEGMPGELLQELETVATELGIRTDQRSWPGQPNTLARRLNKLKVNLLDAGVKVTTGIHTEYGNLVRVCKIPSASSVSSELSNNAGLQAEDKLKIKTPGEEYLQETFSPKPSIDAGSEDTEGSEDKIHTFGGSIPGEYEDDDAVYL